MKTYTEYNRIRPDVLTRTLYCSYAIIMVLAIICHRITGDNGGYFISGPLTLYILFYLGLVQAVQKSVYVMVRVRARRSQYLNAETNMKRSLRIFGIVGAVVGILVVIFGYQISIWVFGSERNLFQTVLVGLCIVFFGVQGVLRGYLQGLGYTKPLLTADLIIAIVSFVPGVVAAALFHAFGDKVNGLFHTTWFSAIYGATGMMLGLLIGAITGFVQVVVSYRARRAEISEFVKTGAPRYLDNKNDVLTDIRPILAVYLSPALMVLLDQVFYTLFTSKIHEDVDYIAEYGMLYGRVLVTLVFLSIICCIPYINSWSRVMAGVERDEFDYARKRMRSSVRNANLLHIPVSVFVFALAGTFQVALFGKSNDASTTLMMIGAPFIVFCCQTLFLSWLITHMGKPIVSIMAISIAVLLHVIGAALFVVVFNMGVKGLLIAEIIAVCAYTLICFWLVTKMLRYRQEWIMSYLFPLVSSIIAGLAAFLLNRFLISVIGEILTLIICMIVFWLVYMLAMVISGGLLANDLKKIPLGNLFMGISLALRR